MRDIALAAIMGVLIPVSFLRPWIGILVWSWFSYLNPHQQCFGFARRDVPWGEFIAIATLGGLVLTKDRKPFIWCRETILMILLWLWFTVTTIFSWYPEDAWPEFERLSKIILMTLVAIPLIQERARLRWVLLVIAGSLGFYGLKDGIFVIATGGTYIVGGPPGRTFVSSNNALALVLNMCMPLFWYLRKDEPRRWVRRLLTATFYLSAITVAFTYSRGGLLCLACVFGLIGARSGRWILVFPLLGLAGVVLFAVAPEQWVARMHTIQTYEQDASAMGRLQAWGVARQIAADSPIVGAGLNVLNRSETWEKYAPELGLRSTDAHSIYFGLLAEQGFVGLGLFIAMALCALGSLISIYRAAQRYKELSWAADYSYMLGVGIFAFLLNGAFLSVAYFDVAWQFFALVPVLKRLVARELESLVSSRAGAWAAERTGTSVAVTPSLPAAVRLRAGAAAAILPRGDRRP